MSWFLWLILAALLTLPVLLRLYVGEEPRNEIVHEQPGEEEKREPGDMMTAA